MICPNEHGPDVECPDCRGFRAVWERLDDFGAPEVSPGFDGRLYARIAAEEARRPWWYRLLWPPVAPLAVASLVAAALLLYVPGKPDATKVSSKTEIEQVAQAVDDLDLLTPIADTRDK